MPSALSTLNATVAPCLELSPNPASSPYTLHTLSPFANLSPATPSNNLLPSAVVCAETWAMDPYSSACTAMASRRARMLWNGRVPSSSPSCSGGMTSGAVGWPLETCQAPSAAEVLTMLTVPPPK